MINIIIQIAIAYLAVGALYTAYMIVSAWLKDEPWESWSCLLCFIVVSIFLFPLAMYINWRD